MPALPGVFGVVTDGPVIAGAEVAASAEWGRTHGSPLVIFVIASMMTFFCSGEHFSFCSNALVIQSFVVTTTL